MNSRLFLFFILGVTTAIPLHAQYWGPWMCPACNAVYANGPQMGAYPYAPGYILGPGPGIKFNLGRIPQKQKGLFDGGKVYLSGRDGYALLGFVEEFSGAWNRALPLTGGQYDLAVELPDGRVAEFSVMAGFGRTNVLLTPDMFRTPQSDGGRQ